MKYLAEGRSFQTYLNEKSLSIDVWDGESLLYLGTVTVPLKGLMRDPSNKNNVQITDDFDIIYKEVTILPYVY